MTATPVLVYTAWPKQVTILKKNIKRADAEIAELDKLIDMTREVSSEVETIMLNYEVCSTGNA